MKINLSDREKIEKIYALSARRDSAHSFLSLFAYQDGLEEFLLTESGYTAKLSEGWLFPVGDAAFTSDFLRSHAPDRFFCASSSDLSALPPDFISTEDAARGEYIYDRAEQNSLPGHSFSRVRAKLSRFEREYSVRTVPLTAENLRDAYGILEKWQPKDGEGDFAGAKLVLDNYAALGLVGSVTYVNGDPSAYVCGGNITSDTFLLLSAKQTSDIQGLNIRAKYDLFHALPPACTFINTESDHGCPGVRAHKLDLRPVRIETSYMVY